jgi:DNA-binding LacI/PurR family transcriptional regulator
MILSLARRKSPGVSLATRKRIEALAARRGYRPDPTISKLMEHLRSRRSVRFQASLAGLSDRRDPEQKLNLSYRDRLLNGMRQRADALGYGFSLIRPEDCPVALQLTRVLELRFRAALGTSVYAEAQRQHFERALELMAEPGLTLGEIAYASGLESPSVFASAFRRRHSVTPSDCRRRLPNPR